ncbi:hypothetical protein Tco_0868275 [Tanacetum coccineum]
MSSPTPRRYRWAKLSDMVQQIQTNKEIDVMDHHEGRKTEEFVEDPMGDGRLPTATHDAVIEPELLDVTSKLLEAAKLHVHIGLNTYLGKINTHVPISSYELSTLNSASNIVLEGNWVSHR